MEISKAYSIAEALRLMEGGAKPAGGFTDICAKGEDGSFVDITGIPELKEIKITQTGIEIGSAVTLKEAYEALKEIPEIKALTDALYVMAGPQVRNVATIAGNIAGASPAADTAPALLVLNATIRLRSGEGTEFVPAAEFFCGQGRTLLGEGQFIESISLPYSSGRSIYIKVGNRNAMAICVAGLAAYVSTSFVSEAGYGRLRINEVRLAAASVADKPVRLAACEKVLTGITWAEGSAFPISSETMESLKAAVLEDISPIDDIRATAEYRKKVMQNLVADTVSGLCGGRR